MKYVCIDCPRRCGARREDEVSGGFCSSPALPVIARAAPHYGEEPCISGVHGSGTVFFSGCNLRCVFCQNHDISRGQAGKQVSVERLRDIFLELQDTGVHNINLVTPTHFARGVSQALDIAALKIPVVWNSSGYENVDTLKMLEGKVQIYMPDFKYMDAGLARKYSLAPDYPQKAAAAILEMYRQRGDFIMDEDGMLQSGVLIRHLIMPGALENTKAVIDWVSGVFEPESVLFSLMCQYTPMPGAARFPELRKRVTKEENDAMCAYMADCGITNGFWQEPESATGEMIPDFDLTGV